MSAGTTVERPMPRDFKFLTRAVKAFEVRKADGSRDLFVAGTASSTVQDRQGDQINSGAIAKMAASAVGLTLYLNHSYDVPEDIFGVCVGCGLIPATDPKQGPCTDMEITVRVEQSNPRAVSCWEAINNGTKLAFSVGGALGEYELREPREGEEPGPWYYEGLVCEIHELKLYEISLVGIPANQRAYVEDAIAKAVRAKLEATVKLAPQKTHVEAGTNLLPDGAQIVVEPKPVKKEMNPAHKAALAEAIGHARKAQDEGNMCDEHKDSIEKCLGVLNKMHDDHDGPEAANPVNVRKALDHLRAPMEHGAACGLYHGALLKCWKCLKTMLPPGYEGDPADPYPSAASPTDDVQAPTGGVHDPGPPSFDADVDEAKARLAMLVAEADAMAIHLQDLKEQSTVAEDRLAETLGAAAAADATLDKALSDRLAQVREAQEKSDTLTATLAAKAQELATLEQKLEEYKAMKLGRFTRPGIKVAATPLPINEQQDTQALAEKRRASVNADTRAQIAEQLRSGQPVDDPRLRSDG